MTTTLLSLNSVIALDRIETEIKCLYKRIRYLEETRMKIQERNKHSAENPMSETQHNIKGETQ